MCNQRHSKKFIVVTESSTMWWCLLHLLPPPRDPELLSRLRAPTKYPRTTNRTKKYQSFISFALNNTRPARFLVYIEFLSIFFCHVSCLLCFIVSLCYLADLATIKCRPTYIHTCWFNILLQNSSWSRFIVIWWFFTKVHNRATGGHNFKLFLPDS